MVAEPVKKGEELFTHYVPWQMDGMLWCGMLWLVGVDDDFFLYFFQVVRF